MKLTAIGKSLADVKIQRSIFQGDAISPLLNVIAMMPLNHILRKCTGRYKLSKSQQKINHLMYRDDIKLFAKNEKELETVIHAVRIYSQGMGIEFNIEKSTEGIELPTQEKIRTLRKKETYKYLGILEVHTSGDER